jgi:hypothetical protein
VTVLNIVAGGLVRGCCLCRIWNITTDLVVARPTSVTSTVVGCRVGQRRGDPHRGHLVLSQRGEVRGALAGDDRVVHGRGQPTGERQPPLLVRLLLVGIVFRQGPDTLMS